MPKVTNAQLNAWRDCFEKEIRDRVPRKKHAPTVQVRLVPPPLDAVEFIVSPEEMYPVERRFRLPVSVLLEQGSGQLAVTAFNHFGWPT